MESKFNAHLFPLEHLALTYKCLQTTLQHVYTCIGTAKLSPMLGACNAVFDICVAISVSGFIIRMGICLTFERLMRCNAQYLLFVQ